MNRKAIQIGLWAALCIGAVQRVAGQAAPPSDLVHYANTLQGTYSTYSLSYGSTYPTVGLPFAEHFYSPQTGKNGEGWKYQYQASEIRGFEQVHQCSPWMGDYAVFSLMPEEGDLKVTDDARGAAFKHENEIAKPNYYKVQFDNGITTEISPVERGAHMRFSFTGKQNAYIVFDGYTKYCELQINPEKNEMTGYVHNGTFIPGAFKAYFVLQFDKPFLSYGTWEKKSGAVIKDQKTNTGNAIGAYLQFKKGTVVQVKMATSYISPEQAALSLKTELGGFKSLDQTKAAAFKVWNDLFKRVAVEGGTEEDKATFYSCLFRANLFSRKFYDINEDGKPYYYSPYDEKVHDGYMYTDNGFWDTFRAQFPLSNILHPEMEGRYMQSLLDAQQQFGFFPAWSNPGMSGVMLGNHAISLLADAWAKGIHTFDPDKALRAYLHEATNKGPWGGSDGREGWKDYFTLGFVPPGDVHEYGAKTLEYCYDDFCAYNLAKMTGNTFYENIFARQLYNYKNLFDSSVGFMHGKLANGQWLPDFDPIEWGGPFTEGNSWQYTWSVFQDINGLVKLMGGEKLFSAKLDTFFTTNSQFKVGTYGTEIHEMTEMVLAKMGQYAHGNEPDMHVPYLYNYVREPWKTQYRVREIMDKLYNSGPKGYPGDEDQGQMSSWYVISALGLYSVCPGTEQYIIGSPLFNRATITLENGNKFTIIANDNSKTNVYIQSAKLNGQVYTHNYINYADINNGGTLDLQMGPQPNKDRGIADDDKPFSLSSAPVQSGQSAAAQSGAPNGMTISGDASARISLNSDNREIQWRVRPQSDVGPDSVNIYRPSYDDHGWVDGVVPGAVFTSYVSAGLEKDPNYADNIYRVDKEKYERNFWYRTTFATPAQKDLNGRLWLHFKGINRKGEVFLNGVRLGLLDGFMQRGDYDITGLAASDGKNVLAVLVHWPGRPIANHASPTYISSDGWDWMPSVPGLLQGITDEVYLTITGAVIIEDPWIRTAVAMKGAERSSAPGGISASGGPSAASGSNEASLSLRVHLGNHSGKAESGVFTAVIQPGNITITHPVTIGPGGSVDLFFDTARYAALRIQDPALWWPNGYGDPNLYTCNMTFTGDGKVSDSQQIKFGVRQYSYDTVGGVLHILVNGKKIFVRGGSWGMSEYMLRCREGEYDWKVKLHREMNYNMIRNWIGSTTDDAFYEACDKYGIMIWDDFWLNSHPNLPDDIFAFNVNAVEKLKRLRNHPSVAVWCGDNEGTPLPPINGWLAEDVKTFDAGDRWYQPNSHAGNLTGSGPWANFHPTWYFTKYPGGFGGSPGWGFRTEIGTAVFTNFESFKKFMPDSSWWPKNPMWDRHFFGPSAANAGPSNYEATIDKSYGKATGIKDFCRKAQLVNIETNKALYEGWQHHMWDDASGVMTWMSQSAYPSMVWQTYDYYYDLTGAYWGVKKACEPIHIQWSYSDNSVKVVNTTLKDLHGLKARAVVYNLDGKIVPGYGESAVLDVPSDTVATCFSLHFSKGDLAYQKRAYTSSGASEAADANALTDGNSGSRWSSRYNDSEWAYVDLGIVREINEVSLNWESAYGKAYKIQVSDDAHSWTDVYTMTEGKGGVDKITLKPVKARYVKMQGIQRATSFGYSLFDFAVYGEQHTDLTPVHFIRLILKDEKDSLLSDNFYWRSNQLFDYTALNTLPRAKLRTSSRIIQIAGKDIIEASVSNPARASGMAFAVRVQAVRASDGERILPALQNDNYFTLMPGESRKLTIEFDPALLPGGRYILNVEPYNDK